MDLIKKMLTLKAKETLFVVDGYHGFCAIPTDLKDIENQIFYLAGGYKYAQAGAGLCFMTIPLGLSLRPAYTGWFADFKNLDKSAVPPITYASDGFCFAGATIEITPFYRFNAVWNQFFEDQIDIKSIDLYVKELQKYFIEQFPLQTSRWVSTDLKKIGHFLS